VPRAQLWPHNGVLVANRSTADDGHGLAVDADDHAILTYNDDRAAARSAATRSRGRDAWGATGVLPPTPPSSLLPVTVTTTGEYIVAWTQDDSFWMQRLDASGVPQWSPAKHVVPTSGAYLFSDLQPSLSGTFIAGWVHYTGGYTGPKYLTRYTASGLPMGLSPVIVLTAARCRTGTFRRSCWTVAAEPFLAGTTWPARAQLLRPTRRRCAQVFPHNGVAASTLANRIRLSPSVACNGVNPGDLPVLDGKRPEPDAMGLYGQRFSSTGSRLRTDHPAGLAA
jgi:hypothetical protein